MTNAYLISAIILAALITVALRAFPFALIKIARRHERLFAFLGAVMPPGIMAILAIYAIATLRWQAHQAWVSIAALAILVFLEHRLRQPVISLCVALAVNVGGQSLLMI